MISCVFEDGKKVLLRHITVAAIVVNDKNQILLTKRAAHLTRGSMWTVPGGFLDRDENVEEAASRELFEETGLVGKPKFLFRINDSPNRPKEDRQNVDFVFVFDQVAGSFQENDETTEIRWVDIDKLPADEEFAFDHLQSIQLYLKHLKKPFQLPIFH